VELMGIEPTASRVRWHSDGPPPNDFKELKRQQTSESVPKRPILATCSQNSEPVDPVAELLERAGRAWKEGKDLPRLRKLLLTIMALLDG
jgi:hypothetical protein